MRIKVKGDCSSAGTLRAYLLHENLKGTFSLSDILPAFTITVEEHNDPVILFDSVDSALEYEALRFVRELSEIPVQIDTHGGVVHSQTEMRVVVPVGNESAMQAVEKGLLRALLNVAGKKIPWWKPSLFVLLLCLAAHAQGPKPTNNTVTPVQPDGTKHHVTVDNCVSGCGGGGGSDVTIHDPTITTQKLGVDASGRITAIVQQTIGTSLHMVCDGGTCGGASPFADNSAFTFNTSGITTIGAVVDDVGTNTVSEDSAGTPRMSINRIMYGDLKNTQTNTNPLNVQFPSAQAVSQSGTWTNGINTRTGTAVTTSWTSATTIDSVTGALDVSTYDNAVVTFLASGGTITGGVATFEISPDGVNWNAVSCTTPTSVNATGGIAFNKTLSTLTSAISINICATAGALNFRVRLSTLITGTGTIAVTAAGTNARIYQNTVFATLVTASTTAVTQTTGSNLHAVLDGGVNTIGSVKLTDGTTVPGVIVATTALKTDTSSIAGTATSTGNGTVGAGVQRVAIASDNTAFSVNSTLAAETTKVIGTTRVTGNIGGIFDTTQNAAVAANSVLAGCNFTTSPASITTGNQGAVQCNSKGELFSQLTDGTTGVSVIAATNALKTDLSSVAGTATATAAAGVALVGIEGRAGTSLETTAGVLDHNLKNINNSAVSTAATGVQKVGIVGNAGANVDQVAGSAVPANVVMVGTYEAANSGRILQCDKTAKADISSATTTSLVAVSGSTSVYVCSFTIEIQGVATTAGTLVLETGTGASCTSPVAVTPPFLGSTIAGQPTVISQGSSLGYVIKGAASSGLCALSTTTTPQKVFISYAQF